MRIKSLIKVGLCSFFLPFAFVSELFLRKGLIQSHLSFLFYEWQIQFYLSFVCMLPFWLMQTGIEESNWRKFSGALLYLTVLLTVHVIFILEVRVKF